MSGLREQRQSENFHKTEKTFVETFHRLKQPYGGDALGSTQCYERFTPIKSGHQSIENDPRP